MKSIYFKETVWRGILTILLLCAASTAILSFLLREQKNTNDAASPSLFQEIKLSDTNGKDLFYDGISYILNPKTVISVRYEGDAESLALYFTKGRSSKKELITEIDSEALNGKAEFLWNCNDVEKDFHGHFEIAIRISGHEYFSEPYPVFYTYKN